MNRTAILRGVLWFGAAYNFVGAAVFAFPGSLGKLASWPAPGSLAYSWMLSLFIAIFGGVYLWLARRPRIDQPLIVVAIVGKISVFVVVTICWLLGELAGLAVLPAVGDLLFGLVFLWWLLGELGQAPTTRS